MWLSFDFFLYQRRQTSGGQNIYSVLSIHIHPHVERLLLTLPSLVCSERKLLLQIVLLSALNGGFLSSLVVMMAGSHLLSLLSLVLFLSSLPFS